MGDEDDEPEFSSAMPLEEGDTFFFAPRPLRNLVLVDELDSLSPVLGNHLSQFYQCLIALYHPFPFDFKKYEHLLKLL